MDLHPYLDVLENAVGQLDPSLLKTKKLEMLTGIWLNSAVLRLQKATWTNQPYQREQTEGSIFFSIWINEEGIKGQRIFYNIHALKLRQLKGYDLTGREFAATFRKRLNTMDLHWPNLNLKFGPRTPMEGWQPVDPLHCREEITGLIRQFLKIDLLIDTLLEEHRIA